MGRRGRAPSLCAHLSIPWKPESGGEWKAAAHLGVPWADSQDVVRVISRPGDLQSTPTPICNPPPGERLPAHSFFFFLNTTGTANSFFLCKSLVAQAPRSYKTCISHPQPQSFQSYHFLFPVSILTGLLGFSERGKWSPLILSLFVAGLWQLQAFCSPLPSRVIIFCRPCPGF